MLIIDSVLLCESRQLFIGFWLVLISYLNMKKRFALGIIILVIIVIIAYLKAQSYQNIFLPEGVKDCGNITFDEETDQDSLIRECFFKSFQKCEPAKIYSKSSDIEGGITIITAVIEGMENDQCKIQVYNYRNSHYYKEKTNFPCYNMELDKKSDYIFIDDCETYAEFII